MTTKEDCQNAIKVMYQQIAIIDEYFHSSIKSKTFSDLFCLRGMVDNINVLLQEDGKIV